MHKDLGTKCDPSSTKLLDLGIWFYFPKPGTGMNTGSSGLQRGYHVLITRQLVCGWAELGAWSRYSNSQGTDMAPDSVFKTKI
jgi:hypothetical protein